MRSRSIKGWVSQWRREGASRRGVSVCWILGVEWGFVGGRLALAAIRPTTYLLFYTYKYKYQEAAVLIHFFGKIWFLVLSLSIITMDNSLLVSCFAFRSLFISYIFRKIMINKQLLHGFLLITIIPNTIWKITENKIHLCIINSYFSITLNSWMKKDLGDLFLFLKQINSVYMMWICF